MKRRPTVLFAIVISVLAASAALVSCKQQEGERCQVSSDCADGLTCGSAGGGGTTLTCREMTPTVFVDAMPVPDSSVIDGASLDAIGTGTP